MVGDAEHHERRPESVEVVQSGRRCGGHDRPRSLDERRTADRRRPRRRGGVAEGGARGCGRCRGRRRSCRPRRTRTGRRAPTRSPPDRRGNSRFPKETLDVIGNDRNGRLDNFQRVSVWSASGKTGRRVLTGQDKGQRSQLDRFVDAVDRSAMPISLESLAATTRATLAVDSSLRRPGEPVSW